MKGGSIFSAAAACFAVFFMLSAPATAAAAGAEITEIMYDPPADDSGREWIEIQNTGSEPAVFGEWELVEDGAAHPLTLVSGTAATEAGGFAVIAEDPVMFLGEWSDFGGALFESVFSLGSAGETLALKSGGAIASEVSFSSLMGAAGDGQSLQKRENGWTIGAPSPGAPNESPFGAAPGTLIENADIASDMVWTKAGSPYVVSGYVKILRDVTVTIEPGVVVKFADSADMAVDGRILAEGTPEERIHFTSFADDSVGGDTNGDGAETAGTPFDWWNIYLSPAASPSRFSYLSVRYASSPFWVDHSSASFAHTEFSHVGEGVGGITSSLTFNDVSFRDVGRDAIAGYEGSVLDIASTSIATLWDFGDAVGLYDSTARLDRVSVRDVGIGSAVGIYGSTVTVESSRFEGGFDAALEAYGYWNWETGAFASSSLSVATSTVSGFPASAIAAYNAEIDVWGSTLTDNGTGIELYGDNIVSVFGNSIRGNIEYGVEAYNTGGSVDVRGNWWGDASGPFHAALNPQGLGDEVYGTDLFSPWLDYDPTIPAPKPDPVIVIPGLLGSAEKNGVWQIDPIFHVYDDLMETLEANGFIPGADLFTFPYDWRQSNRETAALLKEKISAVREMCQCGKVDLVAHSMGGLAARAYIQSPAYAGDVDHLIFLGTPHLGSAKAYLIWEAGESAKDASDRFLKFLLSREAKKAGYPNLFSYVRNRPIASLQELLPTTDYLKENSTGEARSYPDNYPRNLFLEELNNSISFLLDSGVRITAIAGDVGTSTIDVIRVAPSDKLPLWEHGYPDGFDSATSTDNGLEFSRGDVTVSLSSAGFINSDLNIVDFEHTKLPTKTEGLIYTKLTTKQAHTLVERSQIGRILGIKLLSPADIMVITPDGKRIGKNFATGGEVNEVAGAFYSGSLTDNEFVTIPNPLDGEYRVEVEGTGEGGAYTLAAGLVSDAASSERDFTAITRAGMITPVTLSIDAESGEIAVAPVDAAPPDITILSPEPRDYERSSLLPVLATTTDRGSGVFSVEARLNGRALATSAVDLFFERLGTSTVSVAASDYVGNAATSSTDFRIVATASSTISDIERAYALGWISSKAVKNLLISKMKVAIRIERRIEFWEEKLPNGKKLWKRVERLERRIDRLLGRQLLAELKRLHPKRINDAAYQLLKEDVEWLLDNDAL